MKRQSVVKLDSMNIIILLILYVTLHAHTIIFKGQGSNVRCSLWRVRPNTAHRIRYSNYYDFNRYVFIYADLQALALAFVRAIAVVTYTFMIRPWISPVGRELDLPIDLYDLRGIAGPIPMLKVFNDLVRRMRVSRPVSLRNNEFAYNTLVHTLHRNNNYYLFAYYEILDLYFR